MRTPAARRSFAALDGGVVLPAARIMPVGVNACQSAREGAEWIGRARSGAAGEATAGEVDLRAWGLGPHGSAGGASLMESDG